MGHVNPQVILGTDGLWMFLKDQARAQCRLLETLSISHHKPQVEDDGITCVTAVVVLGSMISHGSQW